MLYFVTIFLSNVAVATRIFSRSTDHGPGLEENDPILRRDVIGMDRDIVTGDLSLEDTHFSDSLCVITLFLILGDAAPGIAAPAWNATWPTGLSLPAIPLRLV
jgi:hypothetical protein